MTTTATEGATPRRPKKPITAALPAILHPEQRLDVAQVMLLIGWRRTKLAAEVAAGKFPQPEREGRRCTRWRAGDVLAWLAERSARLRAAPPIEPKRAAAARDAARAATAAAR